MIRPTRDLGCFAWDVDEGLALMHHTWRQRMLFLALCNLVPANLFIDELSPMSIHRVRTEFAALELPTHCGNVGAPWHWRMVLGLRNYRVKIGLMIVLRDSIWFVFLFGFCSGCFVISVVLFAL